MSTMLDNIKAKLEALNQQQNQPSEKKEFKNNSWKPSPGKQTIRILPNIALNLPEEEPFLPLNIYWKLAKRPWLSPDFYGRPDPVIEYCNALIPEGTRLDKEDWMRANNLKKDLLPPLRIYVALLVRGQEHEGVKFWGFSPSQVYGQFRELFEGDYSDAANLEHGIDFTVNYTPSPDPKDYRQAKTVIAPTRNSTPATEDPAVLKMINEMPNILDDFYEPSYDELKTALKTYLQIPKKNKEEKVQSQEEVKPKSNLDVRIDHEASNQGFEVEKVDRKPKASPASIDDIEALFEGLK